MAPELPTVTPPAASEAVIPAERGNDGGAEPGRRGGWVRPGQAARRLAVVALLVVLDLWSKHAIFEWLSGQPEGLTVDDHHHQRIVLIEPWLAFMLSLNPGAAFGKLGQWPHLLVVGRCVAVVFLGVLLLRTPARQRVLLTALVLILAGALGNLHDNLLRSNPPHPFGKVRDFIDVYFPTWDWHFPTFNVADSCITVGAVLLMATCFGGEKRKEPPADPAGSSSVAGPDGLQ